MGWEKFQYARTNTTLPALIVICDELAELISTESLPRSEWKKCDTISGNFQSIARLGRAAHVHLILATQSSSGNLFPPSLKGNIQFRNICGRVDGTISRMAIDSEEGESIPNAVGSYLGWCKGDTLNYQGWFTKIEDILALGTVKEGYDPKTGLSISGDNAVDFSNLPAYVEDTPQNIDIDAPSENTAVAESLDANQEIPPATNDAMPAPVPIPDAAPQPTDNAFEDSATSNPDAGLEEIPLDQTAATFSENFSQSNQNFDTATTPTNQPVFNVAAPVNTPEQATSDAGAEKPSQPIFNVNHNTNTTNNTPDSINNNDREDSLGTADIFSITPNEGTDTHKSIDKPGGFNIIGI